MTDCINVTGSDVYFGEDNRNNYNIISVDQVRKKRSRLDLKYVATTKSFPHTLFFDIHGGSFFSREA
jgi:hypothetical protein